MYYIKRKSCYICMIPCIFMRDKNILLCTMSGRTLKTKTVGAEKQVLSSNLWFEHLGFFSRSFLLCDVFYIDILMYWFSFRGLCCMPTLPENCDSFSHRLAECAVQRGGEDVWDWWVFRSIRCEKTALDRSPLQRLFSVADMPSYLLWLKAGPCHTLWL